jgi:hypothetical protein
MAESVCIKLLTPQSFAIRASVALFNLTPLWTTTSPNRISAQFLQSRHCSCCLPETVGLHGERFNCLANCTYQRVWWPHANVEGISSASRRMFAARKRVQRRLRKEGPYRTGFRVQGDGQGPGTAQRTLTRNRSWAGWKMRRHEDNCRADVKWMNGYALRPHHELSEAHRYPA